VVILGQWKLTSKEIFGLYKMGLLDFNQKISLFIVSMYQTKQMDSFMDFLEKAQTAPYFFQPLQVWLPLIQKK